MTTDILFVHSNFPGQFKLLAEHLARTKQFKVFAIGSSTATDMEGVALQRYSVPGASRETHSFAVRFDLECRRAEQVIYAANALKFSGVSPKVIFVHPGWGEALPLRQVFPAAKICVMCEFYYKTEGADVGFDKEFPGYGVDGLTRIQLRNAATLLALVDADVAIAPTKWQRGTFPREFKSKIRVLHEGINSKLFEPQPATFAHSRLPRTLQSGDEVLTFAVRNLEPYRGFHVFMRALPRVLAARPNAQICIAGGTDTSYGAPPVDAESWKSKILDEVGSDLDLSRVHFLDRLPYDQFVSLLRVSRAHVYLTYPFVLSWSLLEAMALGCLVVASDTAPVREVIRHQHNGLLAPFFDVERLASTVTDALARPKAFAAIRKRAATTVRQHYCFESKILPQYLRLIAELAPPTRQRRQSRARQIAHSTNAQTVAHG